MMLFISVIIPIYNAEEYLKECLDSVINQTLKEIEIICINDGSTDNSHSILLQYAKEDSRIVIVNQENKGVSTARNIGITKAEGEFIAFMDPDDMYPGLNVLSTMYEAIIRNDVNICGGSFSELNENEEISYFPTSHPYTFVKEEVLAYNDYQYDYGYHRFLYRREFLFKNNIFFPLYKRYQDPPFFIKAMILSNTFASIPDVTYLYRTGHQRINWDQERKVHLASAIYDTFEMALDSNLLLLAFRCIERVNKDYKNILLKGLIERADGVLEVLEKMEKKASSLQKEIVILPLRLYRNKTLYFLWLLNEGFLYLKKFGFIRTFKKIKEII